MPHTAIRLWVEAGGVPAGAISLRALRSLAGTHQHEVRKAILEAELEVIHTLKLTDDEVKRAEEMLHIGVIL